MGDSNCDIGPCISDTVVLLYTPHDMLLSTCYLPDGCFASPNAYQEMKVQNVVCFYENGENGLLMECGH